MSKVEEQQIPEEMLEAIRRHLEPTPTTFGSFLKKILSFGKSQVDTHERRRFGRLAVGEAIKCATEETGQIDAELVELSLGGMRLKSPKELRKRTGIAINPPEDSVFSEWAPVMCQVVWCRRPADADHCLVGLCYHGTAEALVDSWVAALLSSLGFGNTLAQRREHVRAEAEIPVVLARGHLRSQGVILNLGLGGALLVTDSAFPKDKEVELTLGPMGSLPVGHFRAEVLSCRAENTGEEDEENFLHGLRFLDMPPENHRLLTDYVLEVLEEESSG